MLQSISSDVLKHCNGRFEDLLEESVAWTQVDLHQFSSPCEVCQGVCFPDIILFDEFCHWVLTSVYLLSRSIKAWVIRRGVLGVLHVSVRRSSNLRLYRKGWCGNLCCKAWDLGLTERGLALDSVYNLVELRYPYRHLLLRDGTPVDVFHIRNHIVPDLFELGDFEDVYYVCYA